MADDYCYLTTTGRRTGQPHRVEMWYAADEATGTLYVLSGGGRRSDWVRNLMARPAAQIEVEGRLLAARARVLEAGEECERARDLVYAKYAPRSADDLTGWRRRALPIALDLTE